jgi:hypothetical protein
MSGEFGQQQLFVSPRGIPSAPGCANVTGPDRCRLAFDTIEMYCFSLRCHGRRGAATFVTGTDCLLQGSGGEGLTIALRPETPDVVRATVICVMRKHALTPSVCVIAVQRVWASGRDERRDLLGRQRAADIGWQGDLHDAVQHPRPGVQAGRQRHTPRAIHGGLNAVEGPGQAIGLVLVSCLTSSFTV